jgi:hypothetical protein
MKVSKILYHNVPFTRHRTLPMVKAPFTMAS